MISVPYDDGHIDAADCYCDGIDSQHSNEGRWVHVDGRSESVDSNVCDDSNDSCCGSVYGHGNSVGGHGDGLLVKVMVLTFEFTAMMVTAVVMKDAVMMLMVLVTFLVVAVMVLMIMVMD
jgi:hypothetical protein